MLVIRNSASEDFVVTYAVVLYSEAIAGVALDGVNSTIFDLLDDTDMIGLTVLRTGASLAVPIEEDDHASCARRQQLLYQEP